jgi:hypothetical protein
VNRRDEHAAARVLDARLVLVLRAFELHKNFARPPN